MIKIYTEKDKWTDSSIIKVTSNYLLIKSPLNISYNSPFLLLTDKSLSFIKLIGEGYVQSEHGYYYRLEDLLEHSFIWETLQTDIDCPFKEACLGIYLDCNTLNLYFPDYTSIEDESFKRLSVLEISSLKFLTNIEKNMGNYMQIKLSKRISQVSAYGELL